MALIRQSEIAKIPREALVLDLGDLIAQGRRMEDAARSEAERILTEARAERARIVAGAREAGWAQGLVEGRTQGQLEGRESGRNAAIHEARPNLDALAKAWTTALESFERSREAMLAAARSDLIHLALRIAERVTKRRIELDPSIVLDQVAAAAEIVAKPTLLTLSVHPDDAALVREGVPALAARVGALRHAEIREDASIARGSCVVATAGGGVADASIEAQLARVAEALLPAPGEAASDGGAA